VAISLGVLPEEDFTSLWGSLVDQPATPRAALADSGGNALYTLLRKSNFDRWSLNLTRTPERDLVNVKGAEVPRQAIAIFHEARNLPRQQYPAGNGQGRLSGVVWHSEWEGRNRPPGATMGITDSRH
jgi:hypothetical protein